MEDKKQRMSIEKSVNGLTHRINVKQIENGFLVCKEIYGDKDGNYISESKEYFSKTNPLDTKEDKNETEELADKFEGLLNSLDKSEGFINID